MLRKWCDSLRAMHFGVSITSQHSRVYRRRRGDSANAETENSHEHPGRFRNSKRIIRPGSRALTVETSFAMGLGDLQLRCNSRARRKRRSSPGPFRSSNFTPLRPGTGRFLESISSRKRRLQRPAAWLSRRHSLFSWMITVTSKSDYGIDQLGEMQTNLQSGYEVVLYVRGS